MDASVSEATTGDEVDRRSKEQRQERVTEVKARLQELDKEYEGREMTGEAKQEFEDLENERLAEERVIGQLEDREAVLQRAAANPEARIAGAEFHTRPTSVPQGDAIYDLSTIRGSENPMKELRDRAKTVVSDKMQFPQLGTWSDQRNSVNKEDVQAHIFRLIDKHESDEDNLFGIPGELSRRLIWTSSELYRKAFWKQAASMGQANLSSEEQRALAIGSPPGAGSAVPVTLDPTVIPTSNSSVNPIRSISRIETLSGSNTWNGVSSGAIVAGYVAEATAGSDNTPTIAAPSAQVQKAHAFVPFSYEAGGDWGALEAEMGRLFQDSKDDLEAVQFITGVGTTVFPQGVAVGATSNNVAAATGLTVTAANLYSLENALPPRFRPREKFIANRGIYNVVRGIDTAGGAALWLYVSQGLNNQAPSPGNTGATLLGAPAYEATGMQATVVNATKIMIAGDFNYYLVLDRIGMNIEFIPNLFSGIQPTGQRGLYAWWRNTAKVLSANAFATLTGTT